MKKQFEVGDLVYVLERPEWVALIITIDDFINDAIYVKWLYHQYYTRNNWFKSKYFGLIS